MKNTGTSSAQTAEPWKSIAHFAPSKKKATYHEILTNDIHSLLVAKTWNRDHARLIAAAPGLLRIAVSATVAFEERISCLRDDLKGGFCDVDDISDQIGNYQWLLDDHRKVIATATGIVPPAATGTATDGTSTAAEDEVRKFKENFGQFFSLRAEAKIQLALDILWHVSAYWDEDNLVSYPKRMPSFNEFVSALGEKLHRITRK